MKRTGVFFQLIYHFVWATKDREPLLTPAIESCLFPYISGKCKELDYTLYAVNGTLEHLHILLGLTPTALVADVAKNLKHVMFRRHKTALSRRESQFRFCPLLSLFHA